MASAYEKTTIDGTVYNVLGKNDDGRYELIEDGRLDYAVSMFAIKAVCPECGTEFYVLDQGPVRKIKCSKCGEETRYSDFAKCPKCGHKIMIRNGKQEEPVCPSCNEPLQ